MIEACRTSFLTDNEKLVAEIDRMERNVNEITHDIVRYGTEVGQSGLSPDLSMILNSCISGVGDIERIGDHATNLVEMYQFLQDHKLKFSPKALEECKEMFDLVISAVAKRYSPGG
jgi:phosphate:Na+ symporter